MSIIKLKLMRKCMSTNFCYSSDILYYLLIIRKFSSVINALVCTGALLLIDGLIYIYKSQHMLRAYTCYWNVFPKLSCFLDRMVNCIKLKYAYLHHFHRLLQLHSSEMKDWQNIATRISSSPKLFKKRTRCVIHACWFN
jgi:hypothetical protein